MLTLQKRTLPKVLASPPFVLPNPEVGPRGEQWLAHDFADCA